MSITERVADRMGLIEESATFAVADQVKKLRAEGREVWDLGGGDPDFATPDHVNGAAIESMEQGNTHYVASRGLPELRTAISKKFEEDNGLDYDPLEQIIVTPSAKHALFIALLTTVNPGDEVLLPSPSWVSYEAIIRFVGGVPAFVPLESEQGFVLTAERLRSALTPRTRMILVNSPNNPTGRALTREEVTAVAEVAEEADLLIISDEIYEKILYDDREAISLGTMPGCLERTLTINGFSKAYAMTGWRLGYVAGPQEIIAEVLKAQQHTVGCAGSFVQAGGLAALTGSQDCVAEMVAEYATRRNFIAEALDELPGVRCPKPDGAFYVFPQVEASMFGDDTAFTNWLLESAGVAVTPGCAFGPGGAGHVRMSFANSQTILEGALEAMRRVWPSS